MPYSFPTYPEDLTGTALTNRILNESRVFTTAEERIFVPSGGPFYASTMIVRDGATNQLLQPNTDYRLLHLHREGTMASGKTVVSIVHVLNSSLSSVLLSYQNIGGTFSETASTVAQLLQDNPPIAQTVWGQIIGQPPQYAPAEHLHNADELYGLGDVVSAIEHLRMAVLANDAMAIDAIYLYINNRLTDENYVTQAQLAIVSGATRVRVYPTLAHLKAGTDFTTYAAYLHVVLGEATSADQHGRLYVWNPVSLAAENVAKTIVSPDSLGVGDAGRYVSILRVEEDLQNEIVARAAAVQALTLALSNETTLRANADTAIQGDITALTTAVGLRATTTALNTEVTNRTNGDLALQANITSEAGTRAAADTALQGSITALTGVVAGKASTTSVTTEAATRLANDNTLQDNIDNEATARQTGDQNLQNQIDALSGAAGGFATTTQLNTEITDRQNAIAAEATARQNTDTALVNAIADLTMDLTTETVARANADLSLLAMIAGMESAAWMVAFLDGQRKVRLVTKRPGLWINGAFRMGTATLVMDPHPADTFYHIYAYWDGTDIQLETSLTGYTTEASGIRAFVKNGDVTRTLVGLWYRDDDNTTYSRSVYGDRRQYANLFDPNVINAHPYVAKVLDPSGTFPFNCTTLAAEYNSPSPVSDVPDFEMPVLFFANENMSVRWRFHFLYTTISGTALGTIRLVSGRPSTGFLTYMDLAINDPAGGSDDRVNIVTAEGTTLIGQQLNAGVSILKVRAARNSDPDGGQGAGNYLIPRLNTAIVQAATYAGKVSVVDTGGSAVSMIPNNNYSFLQLIYDEPTAFGYIAPII